VASENAGQPTGTLLPPERLDGHLKGERKIELKSARYRSEQAAALIRQTP
jgi:hypothetical protein